MGSGTPGAPAAGAGRVIRPTATTDSHRPGPVAARPSPPPKRLRVQDTAWSGRVSFCPLYLGCGTKACDDVLGHVTAARLRQPRARTARAEGAGAPFGWRLAGEAQRV